MKSWGGVTMDRMDEYLRQIKMFWASCLGAALLLVALLLLFFPLGLRQGLHRPSDRSPSKCY